MRGIVLARGACYKQRAMRFTTLGRGECLTEISKWGGVCVRGCIEQHSEGGRVLSDA